MGKEHSSVSQICWAWILPFAIASCVDCIRYLGYDLNLRLNSGVPNTQTRSMLKHEAFFLLLWQYHINEGDVCRSLARISVSIASLGVCWIIIESHSHFEVSGMCLWKGIATFWGIFAARQLGIVFYFFPKGSECLLGAHGLNTTDEHLCVGCTSAEWYRASSARYEISAQVHARAVIHVI